MKISSGEGHRDMNKCPQKLCPSYEIADVPGSQKLVEKGEKKKHQEYPDFRSNDY